MIKVFLFHIYWTLSVAMVTKNGCQNSLKLTKCHFEVKSRGLAGKLAIEHKQIPKIYLNG